MFFLYFAVVLPLLTRRVLSASKLLISDISLSKDVSKFSSAIPLGTYGVGKDVYDLSHLLSDSHDSENVYAQGSRIIAVPDMDASQVFYIQEAGVDKSLRSDDDPVFTVVLKGFVDGLKDKSVSGQYEYGSNQQSFRIPTTQIIHQTETSAIIAIPNDLVPELDMLLPRFLVRVHIPLDISSIPVPADSISRVQRWLDALEFNADIADIVDSISEEGLFNDIRYLTGEDPKSGIVSRHSFTSGARDAAEWIKAHFEESGLQCELQSFLIGFSPNVICGYPELSNISEHLVLGAHYDSRGSFGSLRAPGADDDGSGTIALLEIARTIKDKGVKFNSNVKFAAFAGEEQGLLGSHAYAQSLREHGVDVAMMIQADMLGYHHPEEPPQLGYTPSVGTIEVAHLIANVSALYSPELTVGPTQACCSDHQRFYQQGFAAMQIFERAGPIIDPMYHNSGDLSNRTGYDIGQIKSIAKVALASLLHSAGFTTKH